MKVFELWMWRTGFDVKTLSCLYLDKPLKAHTLMQAIARANRVAEGKSNGLIIDYIGIVKALREALADYTVNHAGPGHETDPTIDKDVLTGRIRKITLLSEELLKSNGFMLKDLIEAEDFAKLSLLKDAANAMSSSPEVKKRFRVYAAELKRLGKYIDRDDLDADVRSKKDAVIAIYEMFNKKKKHTDNSALMAGINSIVSEYIEVQPQEEGLVLSRQFDISRINFDLLYREFSKKKRENLVLKDLELVIEQQVKRMLYNNPGRIDYYDRYRNIIDAYNCEQDRVSI